MVGALHVSYSRAQGGFDLKHHFQSDIDTKRACTDNTIWPYLPISCKMVLCQIYTTACLALLHLLRQMPIHENAD